MNVAQTLSQNVGAFDANSRIVILGDQFSFPFVWGSFTDGFAPHLPPLVLLFKPTRFSSSFSSMNQIPQLLRWLAAPFHSGRPAKKIQKNVQEPSVNLLGKATRRVPNSSHTSRLSCRRPRRLCHHNSFVCIQPIPFLSPLEQLFLFAVNVSQFWSFRIRNVQKFALAFDVENLSYRRV